MKAWGIGKSEVLRQAFKEFAKSISRNHRNNSAKQNNAGWHDKDNREPRHVLNNLNAESN
jgi:hypothetical protein